MKPIPTQNNSICGQKTRNVMLLQLISCYIFSKGLFSMKKYVMIKSFQSGVEIILPSQFAKNNQYLLIYHIWYCFISKILLIAI